MEPIGIWEQSNGPHGIPTKYLYFDKRRKKGEGMACGFWCNQILIFHSIFKEYTWINIDRQGIESWNQ